MQSLHRPMLLVIWKSQFLGKNGVGVGDVEVAQYICHKVRYLFFWKRRSTYHVNRCFFIIIIIINFFYPILLREIFFFGKSILWVPDTGEYWNISGVPVLPENVIHCIHSLEHASVIQKLTILECKNGLVWYCSIFVYQYPRLEVHFFPFLFLFFLSPTSPNF